MGTRASTNIYQQWAGREPVLLVTMYRQFDGYYGCHGKELAAFLASRPVVNGLRESVPCFNGAGCCAAQVIAEFKDEPGGIYINAPVTNDDQKQEYHYDVIVHAHEGGGHIEMAAGNRYDGYAQWRGSPAEFAAWVDQQEAAQDDEE